jgi:hypothetical protein
MVECKAACRLHLIILNRRNIGIKQKKLAQVLHDLAERQVVFTDVQ